MMVSTTSPPESPPSQPVKGQATVLVVDGNATSRRFVELTLGRTAGFAVEAARDAAGALEVLNGKLIELVVCDTDLGDMAGLDFFRRLSQESRFRNVSFVFLSADKDTATRVAALRAGADDYIVKPCDVAELVARAEAAIARRRRMRDDRPRSFALAGELSVISLPDLVGIVEMGQRSGTLSIVTTNVVGRLYFELGRIVHAVCGNLVGTDAFYRLFRETSGQFEFTPGPSRPEAFTVQESSTGLILEAARLLDTDRASRPADVIKIPITTRPPPPDHGALLEVARVDGRDLAELLRSPVGAAARTALANAAPREPPLVPDSMLAAQFEMALRDEFALGELSVWNESDLADWTRREVGRNRLHVHLVADMIAGVSTILALAGSPTERWVLDSLSPTRKAFGLTFHLRHERILDVVLVDAAAPTSLLPSLRRSPAVMFVCPPRGNLLGLGTGARFELERLIESVRPAAVVGVGNEALQQGLSEMSALRDRRTVIRCTDGELGDGTDDLRGLLIKGVRLWSSTGPRETRRPQDGR